MPCSHIIEIHNDSGSTAVYVVNIDGEDFVIEGCIVLNYCPICGEQLRQVTEVE